MIYTNLFIDIGVSVKDSFSDEEYNNLLSQFPQANELRKEKKKYIEIEKKLSDANVQKAAIEKRNSELPDNSLRITELDSLIGEVNAAYSEASILEKNTLDEMKEEYEAERLRLIAEQTPTDLTQINSIISGLETELENQKTVVNGIAAGMGMGEIYG